MWSHVWSHEPACGLMEQAIFWRRKGALSCRHVHLKQSVAASQQGWDSFQAWLEAHANGIVSCSTCCFLQDQDGSLAQLREALTGVLARPKGYRLFPTPGASKQIWWLEESQVSFIHRTLCLQVGKKCK